MLYVSPEALVPADRPLRPIRVLANRALERLSGELDKLHAAGGRGSIAPEKLLRGEVAGNFFVAVLADPEVTPHVTQHGSRRRSAIDGRTTRHPGHAVSQRVRKRIEEVSGWRREIGRMRRTLLCGLGRVGWSFTLRVAACNLIRPPKLVAAAA